METKFGTKFENTGFWKILKCLIEWLMIICSVGCSGVIVISTIMRYFLTKNWYGADEIILMFAFWLYFMGAAYGSITCKKHQKKRFAFSAGTGGACNCKFRPDYMGNSVSYRCNRKNAVDDSTQHSVVYPENCNPFRTGIDGILSCILFN